MRRITRGDGLLRCVVPEGPVLNLDRNIWCGVTRVEGGMTMDTNAPGIEGLTKVLFAR